MKLDDKKMCVCVAAKRHLTKILLFRIAIWGDNPAFCGVSGISFLYLINDWLFDPAKKGV